MESSTVCSRVSWIADEVKLGELALAIWSWLDFDGHTGYNGSLLPLKMISFNSMLGWSDGEYKDFTRDGSVGILYNLFKC